MHITQIVFSPTGGTQRVVDCLTAAWGAPAARIDLTDPAVEQADLHLGQTDLAVIAAPAVVTPVAAPLTLCRRPVGFAVPLPLMNASSSAAPMRRANSEAM